MNWPPVGGLPWGWSGSSITAIWPHPDGSRGGSMLIPGSGTWSGSRRMSTSPWSSYGSTNGSPDGITCCSSHGRSKQCNKKHSSKADQSQKPHHSATDQSHHSKNSTQNKFSTPITGLNTSIYIYIYITIKNLSEY